MTSSVIDIAAGNRQIQLTPEMLQLFFEQRESRDDREAYLLIRDGRRWGNMQRLTPGSTIPLGRVATDGVVIQDDKCSRIHCELYLQDDTWYVRDLGSRNGTLLNGELLQVAVPVESGDIIRIGHTKLMFTQDLADVVPSEDDD